MFKVKEKVKLIERNGLIEKKTRQNVVVLKISDSLFLNHYTSLEHCNYFNTKEAYIIIFNLIYLYKN